MTNIKMCDNCKQMIKDKQPAYITINMNGLSFGVDCHVDCVPDWLQSIHAEQTAKYKTTAPTPQSQYTSPPYQSPNVVTF